jgi:hypothetical protein
MGNIQEKLSLDDEQEFVEFKYDPKVKVKEELDLLVVCENQVKSCQTKQFHEISELVRKITQLKDYINEQREVSDLDFTQEKNQLQVVLTSIEEYYNPELCKEAFQVELATTIKSLKSQLG